MSSMDQLGMNFTADGSTMSRKEVEKQREKKGECVTCGQKLYERKMFQKVPLTINGLVLNGRCLNCKPVSSKNLDTNVVLPAAARTATSSDMRKIEQQQHSSRRGMRASSRRITSGVSTRISSRNVSSRSMASSTSLASSSVSASITEDTKEEPTKPPPATPQAAPTTAEEKADEPDANGQVYTSAIANMAAQRLAQRMMRKHHEDKQNADKDTVDSLLSSMQTYTNDNIDYDNITKCFTSLTSLLEEDKHKNMLMEHENGCAIILQLLTVVSNDNHEDKLLIMEEGMKCIHAVATDSSVVKNNNDILEMIVSCYSKIAQGSSDLTQLVLETICNISSDLSSIDVELMDTIATQCKTVIPYAIQCMNVFLENITIQTKACIAITNLSSVTTPSVLLSVKNSIIKEDGFNAINIAMMMHGSESDFLSHSLSTLRHLCDTDKNNQQVKVLIAESGGIDNAIKAMQDHRDVVDVQEKGCWAISTLATLSTDDLQNYKIFIGDLGGIDVIVRALWVHMDNLSLVQEGLQGLWTLSVENANRDRMVEIGAITVIVSCMRAHQGDDIIQSKSCGILANISANNDNHRIKIVNEEGLDVIIMAMILHSESKNVQSLGVTALKKLTSESTIGVMRECGVDGVLVSAKEKFPNSCASKANYILQYGQ